MVIEAGERVEGEARMSGGRAPWMVVVLAACSGRTGPDSDSPAPETGREPVEDTAPTEPRTDGRPPEMVQIPAGSGRHGAVDGEIGATPGEPGRDVTVSYDLLVGRHEVTQAQFAHHTGAWPSAWGGCARCPVERVSWNDAAYFAHQLSLAEGLESCFTCSEPRDGAAGGALGVRCEVSTPPAACGGYRLPTEAEWEHAARDGGAQTGPTPGGGALVSTDQLRSCAAPMVLSDGSDLGEQAWYCGNSDATPGNTTRPVGGRAASALGLHDLLGNVWEMCLDGYEEAPQGGTDPLGAPAAPFRVVRGGGWDSAPRTLRLAFRTSQEPSQRSGNLGFRVVRTVLPAE